MRAKLLCWSALVCAILASLQWGSSDITLTSVIFSGAEPMDRDILWGLRSPRVVIGAIAGTALAIAGVLSQGLFRNSLASPSVIGTTSGAVLAVAAAFYWGAVWTHWWALPLAAWIGGAAATLLLWAIASRSRIYSVPTLLLAGFALNVILSAMTSLILALSTEDVEKFPALMNWMFGQLDAKSWKHVIAASVPISIASLCAYRIASKLDILQYGEELATSLSIDAARVKQQIFVLVALLVGTVISLAGALVFVGLAIPHITRILIGTAHRPLVIYSGVNGATLVLVADLVARRVRAPAEIPVGIFLAIIGGGFFLWLLFSEDKTKRAH